MAACGQRRLEFSGEKRPGKVARHTERRYKNPNKVQAFCYLNKCMRLLVAVLPDDYRMSENESPVDVSFFLAG